MPSLKVIKREGFEEYSQTLAFQTSLLDAKAKDPSISDMLVFVEHEEVYTVGRSVPFQDSGAAIISTTTGKPVRWIEVGRGGQATFHGPGQLVVYPIFNLLNHGKDVHLFLRNLEQVIILTLKEFNIPTEVVPGKTGVWYKTASGLLKKIASLGIGVRKWISYHGVAINLNTDLTYFRAISPCGESSDVMTSVEQLWRGRQEKMPTMGMLQDAFVKSVREVFNFDVEGEVSQAPDPAGAVVRPSWLKVKAPGSAEYLETREIVRRLKLVTVCEEARCPNIGECWSHHTATFMIMGELCTRRCSFCSVRDGTVGNLNPLDPLEPIRVAGAIFELGLKHVVITSVNRDDLADMGAGHFNQTVNAIAKLNPECRIELLIPDMRGDRELVTTILSSGLVTVLNHNIETVPRLYRTVRPGSSFKRSLNILKWAKELHPGVKTKSGIMVGLGESKDEVLEVMDALRDVNCAILTIGQYLQPSPKQLPVQRFVTPEEFAEYKAVGLSKGFSYVESGPLVRSSYHAWQHSAESLEKTFDPNVSDKTRHQVMTRA